MAAKFFALHGRTFRATGWCMLLVLLGLLGQPGAWLGAGMARAETDASPLLAGCLTTSVGPATYHFPGMSPVTGMGLIVKLRYPLPVPLAAAGTGDLTLDGLLEQFHVQVVSALFDLSRGDLSLKQRLGLPRVYVLVLPPSADLEAALAAFSAHPIVEYAEPDCVGYGALIPNDERFDDQWNMHNTGQEGGRPDADVDANEAWDLSTGLPSTVLAVVDTGVDLDHPDLAAQLLPGYDFANGDALPQDDHGHGTHVAGLAAAATSNGTGIAGMCPGCRIMPIKALNSNNQGYYSWWVDAIEYAVDNGADAINMSTGGSYSSQALRDAVLYAYEAGVPIVAAMMNDGTSTRYYPAAYAETIAVGATDRNDQRAAFSNYGGHIDLVAPGVSILSTLWDDSYASWDGTSMAVPHVTGVIGLIHSVRPDYSIEELRTLLRSTADDQVGPAGQDTPGWDRYYGAGRLNAASALALSLSPVRVTLDGPASGLISARYTFVASVTPITAAQPITYTWQASGASQVVHTAGLSDSLTLSWDVAGLQTVTITVSNSDGEIDTRAHVDIAVPDPGEPVTVCPEGTCDYDDLQTAVDAAPAGGTVHVAAGHYSGVRTRGGVVQVLYVDKTITLQGGYDTSFSGPPDPAANPAILDAEGAGRVLYITGGVSPTIAGLWLTGGNAAGLSSNTGGGVYIDASGPLLNANRVFSNTARQGGGVYVLGGDAVLDGNVVTGNRADWGGGLYLGDDATLLLDNAIASNAATYDGGGLYLRESDLALRGGTLSDNTAGQAGGGIYLYQSQAVLNAGTFDGNRAGEGGGLYLWKSDAVLNGNTITGNQAGNGGGLYLSGSAPRLTNNVVAGNLGDLKGSGLYLRGATPRLLHTTLAHNMGGDGSGLRLTNNSTAWMTNTIVAGHAVGVLAESNNTARLQATLWSNTLDWQGPGSVFTGTLNVWGGPAFANTAGGDYHLAAGSPAEDAGVNSSVSTDVDGQARPQGAGYDIGADEFYPGPGLALNVAPSPALGQAGEALTYTLRVTNTGSVALHATVTATLPSHVVPNGVFTWTALLAAPSGAWSQCVAVSVAPSYTGLLTVTLQAAAEEGASGVQECSVVVVEEAVQVGPLLGATVVTTSGSSVTATLDVPAGAVTEDTYLAYSALPVPTGAPPESTFAGLAYRLAAYRPGGWLAGLTFERPMTVALDYAGADLAGLDEAALYLYRWDGSAWSANGLPVVERQVAVDRLVVTAEQVGDFALFAGPSQPPGYAVYLPLVIR